MRIRFEDVQRQWQRRGVQAATAAVGVAAALGATALILHEQEPTTRDSAPVDGAVTEPQAPSRIGKSIPDPAGPGQKIPGSGAPSGSGSSGATSAKPNAPGMPPGNAPNQQNDPG